MSLCILFGFPYHRNCGDKTNFHHHQESHQNQKGRTIRQDMKRKGREPKRRKRTKLSLSLGGSHENRRTRWSPSKWCTHGCHTIRAGEKSSNNQNQNTEKLCSQCVSETIKTLHCVSALIKTKPLACKALLIDSFALFTTNTQDPMNHNVRVSKNVEHLFYSQNWANLN